MGMRKFIAACAASACVIAGLSGTAMAAEMQKAKLMLNWYVTGLHAPLIMGKAKGYFADEGIDLEIIEGRGSGPTVQAVAIGNVDFGFADMTSMMALAAKDAPVMAVGAALQTSPFAVISLEEKGITTPKDVIGKSIAMTPGDSPSQSWLLFLHKNDIAPTDFKAISGDAKTKVNAVITGQADALLGFATDQGNQIKAATGKPVNNMLFADFGVNSIGSSFIVNKSTIEENPELIRHFMAAATKSFEEAVKDPEAAVDAVVAAYPNGNKRESLLAGLKTAIPLFHTKATEGMPPLRVSAEQVQESIDTMAAIGVLKGSETPDQFYNDSFLP